MGKKGKKSSVPHEEAEKEIKFLTLQIVIKASEVTDRALQPRMLCTKIAHLQEWQHTLPAVLPSLAKIWHVPQPSPPTVLCLLIRSYLSAFHSYPSLLHPAEQPGFHIPTGLHRQNFICIHTRLILSLPPPVLHIPCTWQDQGEKHFLTSYSADYWKQLLVITLCFQAH